MARTTSVFDVDASPNAERIRQLNAKAFTVARQSGAMAMETYQQTVRALLALGRTVPDSAGVKPFSRPDTLPTRITAQFAQAPIDVWTSATANTTRYRITGPLPDDRSLRPSCLTCLCARGAAAYWRHVR